ncbi:MAG TPA: AAA family ATPase [Candidatus Saccharimonadales bacterium]|nr:AAA family ATPase [Candidatus Saccharimonadales bacterium]
MARSTTSFVCQECGYDSPQWLGKCPECGNWNSFKEIRLGPKEGKRSASQTYFKTPDAAPKKLSEIVYSEKQRIRTGFSEMDSVLGGGIVSGSVTLLAGDPGIGKSTLLLQVALNVARGPVLPLPPASAPSKHSVRAALSPSSAATPRTVLYVSGEESQEQIKLRATRISKIASDNFLLLSLTDTDAICQTITDTKPALVIIDSIQTMESENAGGLSGSVGQIRYSAASFIKIAKTQNIPILIVGHVTKEGMVAGPMTLSHMVDTVLFLEGEKVTATRILRSLKNRFGPVDEVGIFAMQGEGMIQVENPQKIFLSEGLQKSVPGSVLVVTLEGTRAFLVEIQALAVFSKFPMPRRVGSGIDSRRLELLLAVLQKHCRLPVDAHDIFVNVAGGLKLSDPAADLGICLAVYSSLKNIALPKTVAIAEVGLLGELRKVPVVDKRVKEAKKLGFSNIITAEKYKTLLSVIGGK